MLLGETKVEREVRIRIGRIFRAYAGLLVNPAFMANGLSSGMAVAMFFVLSGIMPYQYERYGIGPLEYGGFFCLCSVGYMAGNSVNRRFVSILGLELASFWGALISALGVGFALLAHLADIGSATIVTARMGMMGFGHGFTVANSAVAAVRAAGADSGSAMGLVGASQMLIGGLLGSGIVALGGDASTRQEGYEQVRSVALDPVRSRLLEVAERTDDADELSDTVRGLYRESRSRRLPMAAAAAVSAVIGPAGE